MDINPVIIGQNYYDSMISLCLKQSVLKRERKSVAINYLCWLTENVQEAPAIRSVLTGSAPSISRGLVPSYVGYRQSEWLQTHFWLMDRLRSLLGIQIVRKVSANWDKWLLNASKRLITSVRQRTYPQRQWTPSSEQTHKDTFVPSPSAFTEVLSLTDLILHSTNLTQLFLFWPNMLINFWLWERTNKKRLLSITKQSWIIGDHHRFPNQVVDALSLEVLKVWLDDLSHLI